MIENIFKLFGDDEDLIANIYEESYNELESRGYFDLSEKGLSRIEKYLLDSDIVGKNNHITTGQANSVMFLIFMAKVLSNVNEGNLPEFVPLFEEVIIKDLQDNSVNNIYKTEIKV